MCSDLPHHVGSEVPLCIGPVLSAFDCLRSAARDNKRSGGRALCAAGFGCLCHTANVDGSFVGFLAISAVVIVTPGQDTALTIRNTMLGGRSAGIATAAGVSAGQAIWTIGASLGLTALLLASETMFVAIRLAGAAYLCYLGAQSLWAAVRSKAHAEHHRTGRGAALDSRKAFRSGVLSNLGNPKMALFFSSLLPQFVAAGPSSFMGMLGLGLVFVTMTLGWLCLYAAAVDRAGEFLRRGPVRRAFDAVTGVILVAFGVRLAPEPR
jgi:threonine/homoserine/homoserine lactone efflux protein